MMTGNEVIVVHAIIKGDVQGVFFRATTQKHAMKLGIEGTVRNVPDGTVEVYAKGPRELLDLFFLHLQQQPGQGSVSAIEKEELLEKCNFEGFRVIR